MNELQPEPAKHIPGPWRLGIRGTAVFAQAPHAKICDIRGWGYLTGDGEGALNLPGAEAVAIQQANARLIAAAPDLLAMARALIEPFADISTDFLMECAHADPGSLQLIGSRGLTPHFATALILARTAVHDADGVKIHQSTGEGVNA